MRTVHITVPGEPVPLARHRHRRDGRTYLPKESVSFRERVQAAWMVEGRDNFDGEPITLRAVFVFPRKPSHLRKDGTPRKGAPRFPPRADTSNLVKAIEDALQGLLFRDDAQVVSLVATKLYGDDPRSELHVAAYD